MLTVNFETKKKSSVSLLIMMLEIDFCTGINIDHISNSENKKESI